MSVHRVKRHTYATPHTTTCRGCGRPFTTRGYGQQCPACWLKAHPRKKRRATGSGD